MQEHKQLPLKSLVGKGIVAVDEIIQAVKDWLGPFAGYWRVGGAMLVVNKGNKSPFHKVRRGPCVGWGGWGEWRGRPCGAMRARGVSRPEARPCRTCAPPPPPPPRHGGG